MPLDDPGLENTRQVWLVGLQEAIDYATAIQFEWRMTEQSSRDPTERARCRNEIARFGEIIAACVRTKARLIEATSNDAFANAIALASRLEALGTGYPRFQVVPPASGQAYPAVIVFLNGYALIGSTQFVPVSFDSPSVKMPTSSSGAPQDALAAHGQTTDQTEETTAKPTSLADAVLGGPWRPAYSEQLATSSPNDSKIRSILADVAGERHLSNEAPQLLRNLDDVDEAVRSNSLVALLEMEAFEHTSTMVQSILAHQFDNVTIEYAFKRIGGDICREVAGAYFARGVDFRRSCKACLSDGLRYGWSSLVQLLADQDAEIRRTAWYLADEFYDEAHARGIISEDLLLTQVHCALASTSDVYHWWVSRYRAIHLLAKTHNRRAASVLTQVLESHPDVHTRVYAAFWLKRSYDALADTNPTLLKASRGETDRRARRRIASLTRKPGVSAALRYVTKWFVPVFIVWFALCLLLPVILMQSDIDPRLRRLIELIWVGLMVPLLLIYLIWGATSVLGLALSQHDKAYWPYRVPEED